MNFEGWSEEFDRAKSRVAESAASVADAARQFNSLDQMASQDEYIHTPDLNIPRDRSSSATPMPSSACSRILPRQLQTDMETETERRNTHVSGDTTTQVHSLPRKEENEEERRNGGRPEADRFGHTPLHVPLLSVVSDVVHQSTRKTKEHTNGTAAANEADNVETSSSRQSARATKNPALRNRVDHSRQLSNAQISYPSTDNSDSDDDADKDYDPIMDMMRQNKSSRRKDQQQTKQQSQIMELPIVRDAVTPTIPEPQQQQQQSFQGRSESSEAGISKKKMNPNRFMENLDQRMSLPEQHQDEEIGNHFTASMLLASPTDILPTTSFVECNNKWEWLRTAASSSVNQIITVASQNSIIPNGNNENANDALRRQEHAPLTAYLGRNNHRVEQETRDPNENFNITASSSVLGAAEKAELERIRQSASGSGPLFTMLRCMQRKPQISSAAVLCFIVLVMYVWMGERVVQGDDVSFTSSDLSDSNSMASHTSRNNNVLSTNSSSSYTNSSFDQYTNSSAHEYTNSSAYQKEDLNATQ